MNGYVRFFFGMSTLAWLAGAVQAEDSVQEVCEAHSNLAKNIMRGRQLGMEMSQMMRISYKAEDSKVSELARLFVMKAFKYPRVYDNEIEEDVVNEFGSAAYSQCFLALEKLTP